MALSGAKSGEKVEIPLVLTSADLTTAEYEKLLFRDQISSYSSEVDGSDNRKTNVKLAAQYCDGTILMPGESFSYLDLHMQTASRFWIWEVEYVRYRQPSTWLAFMPIWR